MNYLIEGVSYDDSNGLIKGRGDQHKLTRTQRRLLEYFIEHPGQTISKDRLMDEVWGRIVTGNSVDQVISVLRGHLEPDPANPSVIVNHYGLGFSFEAQVEPVREAKPGVGGDKATRTWSPLQKTALALALVFLTVVVISILQIPARPPVPASDQASKHLLILPMTFAGDDIAKFEQQGAQALLRSTFDNLQTEGELIFDDTGLTTQQAIEKHWRIEKDLVVMRSNVVRNGEIYESVIELSKGMDSIAKTTLTATSLNELLANQISFMSDFQGLENTSQLSGSLSRDPDQMYIQALAYRKSGDLVQARALIEGYLKGHEADDRARLSLAEILLEEKDYAESEAQLNILRSSPGYALYGTKIELDLAKIKFARKEFELLIGDLKRYQASHLDLGTVKQARVQIQIADAYLALLDKRNAMRFFKQALIGVDDQLNPMIYARSFYGQGKVRMFELLDETVTSLFEKSLVYARAAGNLHQQTLALNALSHIAFSTYQWDRAIELNRQSLRIMELDNDKEGAASGLGTLVAMLNLRGQFSEARQVNERFYRIAEDIGSDALMLRFLHYDAVLAMNEFDWGRAATQIEKQEQLAEQSKDYPMLLNNAFLQLELLLLKKDGDNFLPEWKKRAAMIKEIGFERYQVYMDLYLGRYYSLIEDNQKAIELMEAVSAEARSLNDIKIFVDAQDRLAEVYLRVDPQKALDLLNALEEHDPHPNPYLDLKAQALKLLGRNADALQVLRQARSVYHESWTPEHQALLEDLEAILN